jgi:hypothetical protein
LLLSVPFDLLEWIEVLSPSIDFRLNERFALFFDPKLLAPKLPVIEFCLKMSRGPPTLRPIWLSD